MILSKQTIKQVKPDRVKVPDQSCFGLPERVIQFGTGVLLRGLADYFIDKANKQDIFNGRIVVVKSTASGDTDSFEKQDNLYTLCVRGMEQGKKIEENIINASISRVISAKKNWDEILACARNADIQLVISNTTEVGIVLTKDDVHASPPESFPGKLLSFLHERYQFFKGDSRKGMVIIPTELLPENGQKLLSILLELAKINGLEEKFSEWLKNDNCFCNSLVDRIVPGRLTAQQQKEMDSMINYEDELMIMAESYRLWAIEPDTEKVKQVLSFSKVDEGVIIAPDIHVYRELKLRLLNGSHTFSCGLAHLAGFTTVKQAMQDPGFSDFIKTLMLQELAPSIIDDQLKMESAVDFANKVLDRYRNPYMEHKWLSITLQYSSKMQMRNIPLLLNYYNRFGTVPEYMSLGFAAHILFMKPVKKIEDQYFGELNGNQYPIADNRADSYMGKWKNPGTVVNEILSAEELWGTDLTKLPGFAEAVNKKMLAIVEHGANAIIKRLAKEIAE
jgi:tagaturonate reductase